MCLTELSRAHSDAAMFMDNSIDVMTVKEFVRGFMGKTIEHQANTKLRKLLSVTYDTVLYDITGKVDKRKKQKREHDRVLTQPRNLFGQQLGLPTPKWNAQVLDLCR